MAFSMFQAQTSPIAIDFGTSSIKVLQTATGEDRPQLVVAAELKVPDAARTDDAQRNAFLSEFLPGFITQSKCKGKRAVIGIPSARTFVQHMSLIPVDGVSTEELIKSELNATTGVAPAGIVVRHLEVGSVNRDGANKNEVICLAMSRDTVMQYIDLLKRLKISVVGVHTEPQAMAHAFDHLYRRDGDELTTTLYIDCGWGGTQVVIAHGKQIMFARYIPLGGRNLDQHVSRAMKCDIATAAGHRIAMGTQVRRDAKVPTEGQAILSAAANAHAAAQTTTAERRTHERPREFAATIVNPGPAETRIDLTEILDAIADEISGCIRYHRVLFPERPIDRAIFLGGESRHEWLCEHVVHRLDLPTMLGDPMSRLARDGASVTPGLDLKTPQPGWAVACGLCNAPTDL